jgi:hypothetical protein
MESSRFLALKTAARTVDVGQIWSKLNKISGQIIYRSGLIIGSTNQTAGFSNSYILNLKFVINIFFFIYCTYI